MGRALLLASTALLIDINTFLGKSDLIESSTLTVPSPIKVEIAAEKSIIIRRF